MINFDWMEQALCTQTDPELFFPEGQANTVRAKKQKAKAVCSWCPVSAECLEFAVLTPYIHDGIWGGLEAHEIRRLARRRMHIVVNERGRDRHGYLERVR